MPRDAIVVLGMHRSGTSALAGLLSMLGFEPPKTLMEANVFNKRGYWESLKLQQFHDQILNEIGSQWDDFLPLPQSFNFEQHIETLGRIIADEFPGSDTFVVKDPRICRFAAPWLEALERLNIRSKVVIPIRHPYEVALSLQQRDEIELSQGCLLWLRHTLDVENATRAQPRCFTQYEDLLENWRHVVARIASDCDYRIKEPTEFVASQIDQYLSSEMRHYHQSSVVPAAHDIFNWVNDTYQALVSLAGSGEDTEGPEATLDRVRREFNRSCAQFEGTIGKQRDKIFRQTLERNELLHRENDALHRIAVLQEQADELLRQQAVLQEQADELLRQQADQKERMKAALEDAEHRLQLVRRYAESREKALQAGYTNFQNTFLKSTAIARRDGLISSTLRTSLSSDLAQNWRLANSSDMFDKTWYIQTYPEVQSSGIEPCMHYLLIGAYLGFNPSMRFDSWHYLHNNQDVLASGMNPLMHFLRHGEVEGRLPLPPVQS